MRARLPAAKKSIALAGFTAIRERALDICVGMQPLELPAPQQIEILAHACEPFARLLPYHYLWDLAVRVKHFHERQLAQTTSSQN